MPSEVDQPDTIGAREDEATIVEEVVGSNRRCCYRGNLIPTRIESREALVGVSPLHNRRLALGTGHMDFFIGGHVNVQGTDRKLHSPYFAAILGAESLRFSVDTASLSLCVVKHNINNINELKIYHAIQGIGAMPLYFSPSSAFLLSRLNTAHSFTIL